MKIPNLVPIDLNLNVYNKLKQTQKYYKPEQEIYP